MPEMLNVTVHRPHQIGGCVTEITCGETRIFIDFGSNLPGSGAFDQELSIEGLTRGDSRCDGVFFTHMHADHMGEIQRINPDIPLWMGLGTKRLEMLLLGELSQRLGSETEDKRVVDQKMEAVARARVLFPGKVMKVGKDLTVTSLLVDHSAFDAYMFLIEGGGRKILHTGDFRTHGYLGDKLPQVLKKYVGQVDVVICEGTMMSREDEEVITERQLSDRAREIMREHRRVFVVCSSTNIARLEAFKSAVPDGRLITCDDFQWKVLRMISHYYAREDGRYDFSRVRRFHITDQEFQNALEESFLCFIRPNSFGRYMLDKYGEGAVVIYSQWSGYLDPETPAADRRVIDLLRGREVIHLHTSGHATREAIRMLLELTRSRMGVIPIHTDSPEAFGEFLRGIHVKLLSPGDIVEKSGGVERLRREAEAALWDRYGDDPPAFAARRLEEELSALDDRRAAMLLTARKLAEECREDGGTPVLRSRAEALFTAWLLGLGNSDPLPAHYRCEACHYAEPGEAPIGPELPDKVCPVCGAPLAKSGFDLDPREFLGKKSGVRRIDLIVPEATYQRHSNYLVAAVEDVELNLLRHNGYAAMEELAAVTGVRPEEIPLDDPAVLERLESPEFQEKVNAPSPAVGSLLQTVVDAYNEEHPDGPRPIPFSGLLSVRTGQVPSHVLRTLLLTYRLTWYGLRYPEQARQALARAWQNG